VLSAYESRSRDPRATALIATLSAAGFGLDLHRAPTPAEDRESARILTQVVELAEALPYRSPGLRFPSFRKRSA